MTPEPTARFGHHRVLRFLSRGGTVGSSSTAKLEGCWLESVHIRALGILCFTLIRDAGSRSRLETTCFGTVKAPTHVAVDYSMITNKSIST